MLYFIPAWYRHDDWKENEQVWYRPRTVTEFDDTVKQIQLFSRHPFAPFEILLLGFSPNFRHFLHRQGVLHAPYWSCFDAMQGIQAVKPEVFSFHDLAWPENVEFIYSPFAVIAECDGKKYAQVEFAEDGNMFCVDLYQNDQMVSRNLYDDRGFMSCQIVYQNGVPYREQYFNEDGIWKFARYMDDGHVLINPESSWYSLSGGRNIPYRKARYDDISEVIGEVLTEYMRASSDQDIFVIAMHPLHSQVLLQTLKNHKIMLSFFRRRMEEHWMADADEKLLASAGYIIADKEITAKKIRRHIGEAQTPIRVITPYDSRIEFGVSQHLRIQNILLAADQLDTSVFGRVVPVLAAYVATKNPRARICLFTRSSGYNARTRLLQAAGKALEDAGMDPDLAREDSGVSESRLDDHDQARAIFKAVQCVDEMAVSRTLRAQRVVVDLRQVPDQFLQISAMSMGIPQIAVIETDYAADGKNSRIIRDIQELPDALDYYLHSIEHWNRAQIASYKMGSRFTTDKLVDAWKEVIRNIENQSTAAGQNGSF